MYISNISQTGSAKHASSDVMSLNDIMASRAQSASAANGSARIASAAPASKIGKSDAPAGDKRYVELLQILQDGTPRSKADILDLIDSMGSKDGGGLYFTAPEDKMKALNYVMSELKKSGGKESPLKETVNDALCALIVKKTIADDINMEIINPPEHLQIQDDDFD